MGIQEVFSNFPFVWRNPLTRFPLESTTDYCRKLFYGSTVVTIGLHDLYQSHQSVNHEMSTFKFLHADNIKFSLQTEEVLGPLQFQICPNETNRSSVISHQRPKRRRTKKTLAVSLTFNLQQ